MPRGSAAGATGDPGDRAHDTMNQRAAFEIGGVTIAPGETQQVHIPVSTLLDRTPLGLQVLVRHGKRDGPVMFVSAAVHGDEVIGVEIVRRLLRAPQLQTLRGTLMAVPVVNAFGFLGRSRYLPDRRDLNRCFPGHPSGSLGARLAHIFLSEVVDRADLGIDLHSAAVHRTNLPQIRVSPGDRKLAEMARIFGAPVILTSSLRDGSLRGEAATRGKPVLLYEAGEGLRFDEFGIRAGVAGIMRIMRAENMIPAKGIAHAKAVPHVCQRSSWLRAPNGGLLRPFRAEGDIVAKGDLLAAISDPFGQTETEVPAPSDGILIGRTIMPLVQEGDAIFHLAELDSEADVATVDELAAQLEGDPLFDEDEII
jgi:predicted deacylase